MRSIDDIASWLRAERLRRNLSQAELASQALIPLRSYQRLEAGDPGARLATLLRAMAAMDIELTASSSRRPTLDELPSIYGDEAAS